MLDILLVPSPGQPRLYKDLAVDLHCNNYKVVCTILVLPLGVLKSANSFP